MTWIELAGPVGAGKSALLPATVEAVAATGCPVRVVGGLPVRATSDGHPGMVGARRLAGAGRFGAGHPSLAGIVAETIAAQPLPVWHRRAIASLFLTLADADRRLRRATDLAAVVDEGWAHRAVNLFAWFPGRSPAWWRRLDRYLARIPPPDLLVLVDAEPGLLAARVTHRGLPKRLRGRSPAEVATFLEGSGLVIRRVREVLGERGVPIIDVRNEGTLEAAASTIQNGIRTWSADARPHVASATVAAIAAGTIPSLTLEVTSPFPLPRPALPAWARSSRARDRRPPDPPVVWAVLQAYGLEGSPWRLLDDTGRSTSLRVEAPRGPLVLKRAKASLATDAILGEHRLLEVLEARGFPAPRLVRAIDGRSLVCAQEGRFSVTRYLDGYVRWDRSLLPPGASASLRQASGALLARFHATLADVEVFEGHPARVAPAEAEAAGGTPDRMDLAETLGRLAASPMAGDRDTRDALWGGVGHLATSVTASARMLQDADLPQSIIHGDYGPYNLLIARGKAITVIDLELARRDWRLIDLVNGVRRFATNRFGFSVDRASAFLAGYTAVEPLDPSERRLMTVLVAHLEGRRAITLWSRSNADPARLREAALHARRAQGALTGADPLCAWLGTLG